MIRQTKRQFVEAGRDLMKIINAYTDALYGKDGAEKNNFGLPPIGAGAPGFGGPVDQVVITKIRDGSPPNSIFVDFSTIDNAGSYEAEWFTDASLSFATRVGNVTITQSEFTTPGLTKGQQYWFRVRAIRANQPGPWSDPATRVAGL